MGADQPQRAAVPVTFDLRDDVDPPRLAVVWTHDPVGRGIILAHTLQRAEEMLDGLFAVFGMNPVDPVLVGFIGRIGRQAVDNEIFR